MCKTKSGLRALGPNSTVDASSKRHEGQMPAGCADALRAGRFDGCWCGEDGEGIADIVGHKIVFQDGYTAKLESRSEEEVVCVVLEGEVFSARLDQPGLLRWNDGDVWVLREPRKQKVTVNLGGSMASEALADSTEKILKDRKAEPRNISLGEPGHYRVLQGVVFKKPGADPTTDRGLRKVQEVGSTLATAGRSWQGKNGCEWVELDQPSSPGWVLVQGRGVGMPGPLLQKVVPDEEPPIVLRVGLPQAPEDLLEGEPQELKFVMKASAKMTEVKAWISLLFKLNVSEIRICKPQDQRPSNGKFVALCNLGGDEFVPDHWSVEEASFHDGCLIQYIYTGFLAD